MKDVSNTLLWLKEVSPYAWMPALVVPCISAYYSYQNNILQTASSRPELLFEQVTISTSPSEAAFASETAERGNARYLDS